MTSIDAHRHEPMRLAGRLLRCVAGGYASQDALSPAEDVFLESRAHLDALRHAEGLVGPGSMIFVPPGAGALAPRGATVVEYAGSLSQPGDELVLGDEVYVERQDYVGSAFLGVAGPTVIKVDGEDDHLAFLADADVAVEDGTFPPQLTHPAVVLADVCCLGGAPSCPGLVRLHVSAEGQVRTSAGGRVLGAIGDGADRLTCNLHDGPCASAGVPLGLRRDAEAARPWLPRYVAAVEALRRMHAHGRRECRVSGFGHRLVPGVDSHPLEATALPLLVWDDEGCVLFDLSGRHAFRVGLDAGRLLELLFVTGSRDAASELAASLLGLDAVVARQAVDQLSDRIEAA